MTCCHVVVSVGSIWSLSPWPVGMQPPVEGALMSFNPSVEDHFATMVIPSTLFTSFSVSALWGAHRVIQKSNLQQKQKNKKTKRETLLLIGSKKKCHQLLMVWHSYTYEISQHNYIHLEAKQFSCTTQLHSLHTCKNTLNLKEMTCTHTERPRGPVCFITSERHEWNYMNDEGRSLCFGALLCCRQWAISKFISSHNKLFLCFFIPTQ